MEQEQEKRSVWKVGDQAEREEKDGGEENGLVADLAHKRFFILLVEACDDDHGGIVCQEEIACNRMHPLAFFRCAKMT